MNRRLLLAIVVATLARGTPALGGARPTVDEVLRMAFPEGTICQRHAIVLTAAQIEAATRSAGASIEQELWTRYQATHDGKVLGWAYLDSHRVRSLNETLLVILSADGALRRVEVVAFAEPPEYLPRRAWFDQFEGKRLGADLELNRAIRPVTGATLSSRAATAAVRRVLAVNEVLGRTAAATATPDAESRP